MNEREGATRATTSSPAAPSSRPSGRVRVVRALLLAIGVVLLAYLTVRLGVREIVTTLGRLRWAFVPVVLLYAAHQVLRACAFTYCLPRRGGVTYADAVAVRLSGEAIQFLTFSGPILSEPAKALMLQKRGLTTWEGLAATLAEYLASSLAASVMAVVGLSYVVTATEPGGPVRAAALAILVAMTVFTLTCIIGIAARLRIIGAIIRAAGRLPLVGARARSSAAGVRHAEERLIHVLRDDPWRLLTILGLEATAQICLGVELFCLLAVLQPPFALGKALLIEGAAKFINAGYFFIPGQVGVAEGTYAVIFDVFAIPAAAGFAVSFVRRLRSLLTASIGLAALSLMSARPVVAHPVGGAERP